MEYTQNYNLKKPGQEDFYNVEDFNENADIIDQKLKEIEDKTQNINVTLDTSWLGSAAPYSKSVTVTGILETDTPIIDVVMSGTYSTDEARIEAWGYIYRAVTANGSITFYATEKPTVSLPIQIKVVR
jgi:hypothetical protein